MGLKKFYLLIVISLLSSLAIAQELYHIDGTWKMNSFEGLGENAKSIKNETSPPCFYNLTFEFTDLSFIITAYKGENCSETKVITHEIERENNLIKFKDTFNPNKTNVMEIEYADESKATFIVIEEGIAVMKFHLLKQEN